MGKISRIAGVSLLMGAVAFSSVANALGDDKQRQQNFKDAGAAAGGFVLGGPLGSAGALAAITKADLQRMYTLMMQVYTTITATIAMVTIFWGIVNFDIVNEAIDYKVWQDAKNRQAKLNDEWKDLQAAIRYIGAGEILECEDPETPEEEKPDICSAGDAGLMKSEVSFAALQNVGIEAVEDVAGTVPKTVEEISVAEQSVSLAFSGTQSNAPAMDYSALTGGSSSCTEQMLAALRITQAQCESMYGDLSGGASSLTNNNNNTDNNPATALSQAEKDKIQKRRNAHLQFTGTAGVARADLGVSVARSAENDLGKLAGLMESGSGSVVSNATILAVMDLILSQHLNNLNMVYGQETANEAAMALQYVPLE